MMEERQEGFFEFLINLCSIVGGTLTVLGYAHFFLLTLFCIVIYDVLCTGW